MSQELLFFNRLRSGPFEGPATAKPPALPVVGDSISKSNMIYMSATKGVGIWGDRQAAGKYWIARMKFSGKRGLRKMCGRRRR